MAVNVDCYSCTDVPASDARESLVAAAVRFSRMADAFAKVAAMDGLSVSVCSAVLLDAWDGRIFCEASSRPGDRASVASLYSLGEEEPFETFEVRL